jgi:hypothetical protein
MASRSRGEEVAPLDAAAVDVFLVVKEILSVMRVLKSIKKDTKQWLHDLTSLHAINGMALHC